MKVCFIWVEKFRNFKNFGFNISSSAKFSFNLKENKLSIRDVSHIPKNFFGENITDVVGVIGKNGAGKSNAVELVCKVLKGGKAPLQGNFLIIMEQNNKLHCFYSSNMPEPKADFNIKIELYSGNINPLKLVYFSNVFDERKNSFDREVSDISANNLLPRHILLSRHQVSDFEKQIKLINSNIFSKLNIETPNKVQIINKNWLDGAKKIFNSFEHESEIIDLNKKIKERLRDIKPENKFIHIFKFNFFLAIFRNIIRIHYQNKELSFFKNLHQLMLDIDTLKTTESITDKLIAYVEEEVLNNSITFFYDRLKNDRGDSDRLREQLDFIRTIKSFLPKDIEYIKEGVGYREVEYFIFNFRHKNSFTTNFVKLFYNTNIFEIKWLGISSGHKAYLNLFSSIQQEIKNVKQPNLLLCIDEGDLYLHPKWQIEFFNKLLTVLSIIFSGKIQLLLTSHSPFLLSDLPKQCITILDNEIENSIMDGVDLKINTFGGNLYDLYSEPFFLGNRRTSDFAYNKIKKLIETVEKGKISDKKKKEILQISELIGDEIIKFLIKKKLENDKDTRTS